ncbi:50S ribosomal protein L17 [Geomobilimonas luticola]|uniref:Large ribosomal subunit protein bL17 n=1 Tax=Geomobilimonas luticola TaxID=1114878 RepID=A0ABS5SI44_9BACT|nr:50S ribosomal protein L17 [Geomobilimonas luticola]MBT0654482.1 50S ribosomal protein L17 [Geomobilimonas luticola]
MRHNNAGRRLGRTTSHRIAMFRNMVTSFLNHEKITTTDAKAKELRTIAEKMITLGKKGDLHAMRQAAAYIRDKKVVTKLFTTIAPRYKERPGGYTRIIKLGIRPGDNAPLSIIELVEEELKVKSETKPAKKAPAKKAAPKAAVAVAPAEVQSTEPAAETPVTHVTEGDETCEAKAD